MRILLPIPVYAFLLLACAPPLKSPATCDTYQQWVDAYNTCRQDDYCRMGPDDHFEHERVKAELAQCKRHDI